MTCRPYVESKDNGRAREMSWRGTTNELHWREPAYHRWRIARNVSILTSLAALCCFQGYLALSMRC